MYKIHGFKRVITSLENIQKYKSQYRELSHIRTTPGYDGVKPRPSGRGCKRPLS